MKKIFQFFTDYQRFYNWFKKLPMISIPLYTIGGIVFGIFDAFEDLTGLWIFGLLVWPVVGVVIGCIVAILFAMSIAPIITIADTLLDQSKTEKHQ